MAEGGQPDLVTEYREYLARFESGYGEQEFGAFVKFNGRLVKKLRYEEFEPLCQEYFDMAKNYFSGLDRGDTINDVVVRLLREHAVALLLTSPV